MKTQILKNGLTAIQNLKLCIAEGTATAETFERAIQHEGLTLEIIALLSKYYRQDILGYAPEDCGDEVEE